jgi:putative nucleotidyltransferase with HDIG domain
MSPLDRFLKNINKEIASRFSAIPFKYYVAIIFMLFLALNSSFVGFRYISTGKNFELGKPAVETVISPRTVSVVDAEATQINKRKAREAVKTIYTVDPAVEAASQRKLEKFFEFVEGARSEKIDVEQAASAIREAGFQNVASGDIKQITSLEERDYETFKNTVTDSLRTLFAIRIRPEEEEIALRKAEDILYASGFSDNQVIIGMKILRSVILPNYLPDVKKTNEARNEAEARVKDVVIRKQKGEVIIREGEVVKREHLLVLKQLGLYRERIDFLRFFSVAIFIGLIQLGLLFYFRYFYGDDRKYLMKYMISLTVLFIYNLVLRAIIGTPYQFLAPLALTTVIASMLIDERTSFILFISSMILTMLYPESSIQLLLSASFPALLAIFLMRTIEQQSHLIRLGIQLSVSAAAFSVFLGLMFGYDIVQTGRLTLETSLASFFSVVLSLGLLPFFEAVFHATSPLRLLELASPNHPLLRELMVKAPGTYNHSVLTANLAEAAAHAVGANPLLVRVASYYHDIGKTKRPVFFSENQSGIKNPHDETNPSLSRLIISSHVRDGIEIARKHRLPEEIIDIISQHHGTTLMYPIYKKALDAEGHEVSEEAYRYNYAKPKTKEAAIVMLADSVEAASRSLSRTTPERLEKMISSIIHERLNDGQLDEAPLTLSDLKKIEAAFTSVLSGLYHERIEYPNIQEIRRAAGGKEKAANGGKGRKNS